MTQLFEIKVKLSPNQKKNLASAFHKHETIVLRLSKDALSGNDVLYVPQNVVKRLQKNKQPNKGMDIKLVKTNIRKQVGGSMLRSILSLGRTFAPTTAKTLCLSALAGLASEGASPVVKKIMGRGQTGGAFMIPNNSISDLVNSYNHLFTRKQVADLERGLARGDPNVFLRLSQKQMGSGLGSILASIGVPIAVDLVSKLFKKGS